MLTFKPTLKTRKYYKLIPWTQPTLTAAGTFGGDVMAVDSRSTSGGTFSNGGTNTWKSFKPNKGEIFTDGDEGAYRAFEVAIYVPENLVLTGISLKTSSSNHGNPGYGPSPANQIIIYGGYSKYDRSVVLGYRPTVGEGSSGVTVVFNTPAAQCEAYKYYTIRMNSGAAIYNDSLWVSQLEVQGKQRIEVTENDDYDYFIDENTSNCQAEITQERYYYKYLPSKYVNGTTCGTLEKVNGVVSNFSKSNFVILPTAWNGALGDTFEMVWKFKLSALDKKSQQILAISSNPAYNPWIGISSNNRLRAKLSTNTSGSVLVDITGTTVLTTGIDYWFKFEFTGTQYSIYLSTDGINFTLEASKASTTKWTTYTLSWIGKGGDNNATYPLFGSLDLKECYIKVDGEYWWRGTLLKKTKVDSSSYDFYEDKTFYNCIGFKEYKKGQYYGN